MAATAPQDGINPIPMGMSSEDVESDDHDIAVATSHKVEDGSNGSSSSEEKGKSESFVENDDGKKKCCNPLRFKGIPEAQGYAWLGATRGALVMSNIFLSTSLIYLASVDADCVNFETDEPELIDDCENRVYGFKPASLLANIAVISGILSAFLMPLIGAIIDYTSYRRHTGILTAILIIIIQGIQIYTVQDTWYPMAILQAIAGFLYQAQVLATYSYLPDISRTVGQNIMLDFTSIFYMIQFASQSLFLIVVIGVSIGFSMNDVLTAQVSQAINTLSCVIGFYLGWRLLPNVGQLHELPEKANLFCAGFKQTLKTALSINKNYSSLRWFLLAVVFAEAGSNAFTTVSVIYLNEVLKMSGAEIGIIFLITLLTSLPGSFLSAKLTKRINPNISWICCLITFSIATIIGALVLTGPERKTIAYIWGCIWGPILGWFYSVEIAYFSMCVPKGQESELSGFYVYCSQILVWLPPLVFALLYESGVDLKFGLMSLVAFFAISILMLSFIRWDNVVSEAKKSTRIISSES